MKLAHVAVAFVIAFVAIYLSNKVSFINSIVG
jgi:hypothetical protein